MKKLSVSVPRVALLVAALVASIAYGVATFDRPQRVPAPTMITSSATRFATLDELVAASDEIVLAEAIRRGDGRAISAASDPSASITTELVELRVVQTLKGAPGASLVVEQEVALADGTPVRVDGVAPLSVGQRGVFFLVRSAAGDVPYRAVVGPQGRYLVDGDQLTAAVDDALTRRLVKDGGPALVRAIVTRR